MNKKDEQKPDLGGIIEEFAENVEFEEIPSGGSTTSTNPSSIPEIEPLEKKVTKVSKKELQKAEAILNRDLTPTEMRKKEAIKRSINLDSESSIQSFGAGEQRQITELSKRSTDTVATKNVEVVGPHIARVLGEIRNSRKKKRTGFFANLVGKVKDKTEELIEANKTAEKNIAFIESVANQTEPQAKQDSALLKMIWDKNVEKYDELRLAILAGEEKLIEERGQLALEKANIPPDNAMVAQQVGNKENRLSLFSKRLHDLRISQQLAVLTAVKVNLLEQTNAESLANLRNVVQNVLPIWRQEIAIDIATQRIRGTVDLTKAISDTTNEILLEGARKTHELAKDVAEQSQRPIVDVETIRSVSETHLNTIIEVLEIKSEAEQRRIEERAELASLEKELATRMLATHGGEAFLTGKKKRRWG